jgi:hypothetical protein
MLVLAPKSVCSSLPHDLRVIRDFFTRPRAWYRFPNSEARERGSLYLVWVQIRLKVSPSELSSVPPCDEAQPSARPCHFVIKTRAGIPNFEMDLTRRCPQSHFEVPHSTVLRRIVESFLQNSEEAQRNVRRQRAWLILEFEVNLRFLLLPELLAEASDGHSYA